jgi:CubicO group peptidase (beta-lactamase class C family)
MELGSISKAFTDETILYLLHRGLLQLDDPISK